MPRVLRNMPRGPLLDCCGRPTGGKATGSRHCEHGAGMTTEEQK